MQVDKNKIYISTIIIFWIIFAFFILSTLGMYGMILILQFIPSLMVPSITLPNIVFPSFAILSILGIVLIILAARAKFTKISKIFFILTGSSALGIGVSSVLHNLLFALLIKLFGEEFGASMGDEPVFFILATIVCPLALLVGIIGSIVFIAKKKVIAY